jgi:hypothetical protein
MPIPFTVHEPFILPDPLKSIRLVTPVTLVIPVTLVTPVTLDTQDLIVAFIMDLMEAVYRLIVVGSLCGSNFDTL